MLRKKRGSLALLNHGSLALSVCCGWRKKKRTFWFKYFWGAKGKQKHRRRASEGEAVSTCREEQRPRQRVSCPSFWPEQQHWKGQEGKEKAGDYQLISDLFK